MRLKRLTISVVGIYCKFNGKRLPCLIIKTTKHRQFTNEITK